MKRIAFALGLCALLASHSASAIKVPTGSDDINLNINLLLQPRFEVTFDRTTPDKSADFDFYIRRGRIQVSATAYKMFSFMIQTDNSNWGKAGNLANNQGNGQPFIIQDLLVSFTPIEDFTIDTGLILEPGIRIGSYSASGGQGIVETPTALILDNNAKGFREMGAQLRGFLLARRIHYRVGIWEGVHNQAETASTGAAVAGGPAANPSGKPMLGGHVRFNIIGEETGYAFNQMYLDGKTRASVGFATQFQKHGACAVGLGVTPAGSSVTTAVPPTGVPPNTTVCNLTGPVSTAGTTVADYKMFAGDAFFDAALPGDMEFAVDFGIYRWDYGGNSTRTGVGYAGSVGFRFGPIEPVISGYRYIADDNASAGTAAGVSRATDMRKLAGGLTWYMKGHQTKISAEVNSIITGDQKGPAVNAIFIQTQAAY